MTLEFISGIKEGQKKFGDTIGTIVNSIALTFVYFLGVGATSLFMKLFKKNLVQLEKSPDAATYWEELNLTTRPAAEYCRQF
jgi:hypothetical protein